MEKNLDTLLANQKSSRQLQEEQEEKERLELVKELKRDKEKPTEKVEEKKPEKDVSNIDVDGKILKIKRKVYNIDGNIEDQLITIKNPEGKRYFKYLTILNYRGHFVTRNSNRGVLEDKIFKNNRRSTSALSCQGF